jgi:hypothetical protein
MDYIKALLISRLSRAAPAFPGQSGFKLSKLAACAAEIASEYLLSLNIRKLKKMAASLWWFMNAAGHDNLGRSN